MLIQVTKSWLEQTFSVSALLDSLHSLHIHTAEEEKKEKKRVFSGTSLKIYLISKNTSNNVYIERNDSNEDINAFDGLY